MTKGGSLRPILLPMTQLELGAGFISVVRAGKTRRNFRKDITAEALNSERGPAERLFRVGAI